MTTTSDTTARRSTTIPLPPWLVYVLSGALGGGGLAGSAATILPGPPPGPVELADEDRKRLDDIASRLTSMEAVRPERDRELRRISEEQRELRQRIRELEKGDQ